MSYPQQVIRWNTDLAGSDPGDPQVDSWTGLAVEGGVDPIAVVVTVSWPSVGRAAWCFMHLCMMPKAVHESFANQAKKRFLHYFRLQVKI